MIVATFAVLILFTTRASADTAECNQALGMQQGKIENEAITASSWKDDDHKPQFARLNIRKAWCSRNETSPYLQISLSEVYKITGIETQGSLSDRRWVTKYEIHYTTNTSGWEVYQASNGKTVFQGNSHFARSSRNDFGIPLMANAIRIYPKKTMALFGGAKRACLRVEIYGCKLESEYYFSRSDSVILSGHPDYDQKLNEYLEPVQVSGKQWKLCFRASEHNYSAAAFHTSCNKKGVTFTLVRVGIYVFGGYADKSWDAPSDGQTRKIYSDRAFLFALKNHLNKQFKMFTYRNQQDAIWSKNNWGPDFNDDLAIRDRCDVNANSYSDLGLTYKAPNGYTYQSAEARKLLAGSYNFKCDEYEVFYQK